MRTRSLLSRNKIVQIYIRLFEAWIKKSNHTITVYNSIKESEIVSRLTNVFQVNSQSRKNSFVFKSYCVGYEYPTKLKSQPKTHQYEAIIESIQIGTSSADLTSDCGSIDKYVLWIFKIWKCYSISHFCYSRCMFSILSHHCLPLLLLNLHISSRISWSPGATIQDAHFCDSPIHR